METTSFPRLFNKQIASRALAILRAANSLHGHPPPHSKYRSWWVVEERRVIDRLYQLGLVSGGPTGPRQGWRYRTTELGLMVLVIVEKHGQNYRTPLRLLPQMQDIRIC